MFDFAKCWIVHCFKIYKVGGVRNKQKQHFTFETLVEHICVIYCSENLFIGETLKIGNILSNHLDMKMFVIDSTFKKTPASLKKIT